MTNQRFYTSAFDERLIYFDGIEWHRFYIRKRRITCAEIINADFDTHGIKLPNRSGSVAWVGGGRAFCEFKVDPFGVRPSFKKNIKHQRYKMKLLKLLQRHIYADVQVGILGIASVETHCGACCFAQHPCSRSMRWHF